jgi:hypothetical protein
MIKKYPPQRDAAAGINAQIAAVTFQLRQRAYQWLRGGSSIMHLAASSGVRARFKRDRLTENNAAPLPDRDNAAV